MRRSVNRVSASAWLTRESLGEFCPGFVQVVIVRPGVAVVGDSGWSTEAVGSNDGPRDGPLAHSGGHDFSVIEKVGASWILQLLGYSGLTNGDRVDFRRAAVRTPAAPKI